MKLVGQETTGLHALFMCFWNRSGAHNSRAGRG
jgi:hypothetical protein